MSADVATRAATIFVWGGRCFYCGREASCVDHIVAKTKGGVDSPHNLVAACADCNRTKGDLWLPVAVMAEALEAAQMLAEKITALAPLYNAALKAAGDRLTYGSVPLKEGKPGRALTQRAVRVMRPARTVAVDAAEIAKSFRVIKQK